MKGKGKDFSPPAANCTPVFPYGSNVEKPERKKNVKRMLALWLGLALLLGGAAPARGEEAARMTLLSINVGKADCHLLTWEGRCWMIDTGAAESWGAVSAALMANGITHLDGVVLTHTDKDHAGGLPALASSSVAVDAWYASAYYCEVKKEEKHPAVMAAAQRGQTVTWLKAGDSLPFGSGRLTVLGPTRLDAEKENNNSVVLLAEAAGGSILLAGDMEQPEEEALLLSGVLQPVTVLKVGHHGEGDATSEAFALAVKPQVAVISTNSVAEPDTPSNRVMKLLRRVGAQIALTETAAGGVLVEVEAGKPAASLVSWTYPEEVRTVALTALDPLADVLTLENTGTEAVDLSGWFVRSERGGELFVFPAGASIGPGAALTLSTLATPVPGDYVWADNNVWHNSKDDPAFLYDAWGREISVWNP